MCDYSLHNVASRPAKLGAKLLTAKFPDSYTRGFVAIQEPNVAVCLAPGTELAFEQEVEWDSPSIFTRRGKERHRWLGFEKSTLTSSITITTRSSFPTERSCW